MQIVIKTGDIYGQATILKELPVRNYVRVFECRCSCGSTFIARLHNLRSGTTKSCGCLRKHTSSTGNSTHGLSHIPEYRVWEAMRKRCRNPTDAKFKDYGGRGIAVCERWVNSFQNFYNDMGVRPSKNYWLERVDVNGDYSPENCIWIPKERQAANKRTNVFLTFNNKRLTIAEWAREINIPMGTLWARIKSGWTTERALSTPILK